MPSFDEQRNAYVLWFSVRPMTGKTVRRRAQGQTKALARRRARAIAKDVIQASSGGGSSWKLSSSLGTYIDQVSRPYLNRVVDSPNTRSRYNTSLKQLLGDCEEDAHRRGLRKLQIAAATTYRPLEEALLEIAELHGISSARVARSVLNKYVVGQLVRDGILAQSPLTGVPVDFSGYGDLKGSHRGAENAFELAEVRRVMTFLLELDPHDVPRPKRGRYSHADAIAQRSAAIDMALLQLATGMRQNEARQVTRGMFRHLGQGQLVLFLPPHITKNHKPRTVAVFFPEVAARLWARVESLSADQLVFGSPAMPDRLWARRNCTRQAQILYEETGTVLELPIMLTDGGKSHIWRASLNTILMQRGVSSELRIAQLGHSDTVNLTHYVNLNDPIPLLQLGALLQEPSGGRDPSDSEE